MEALARLPCGMPGIGEEIEGAMQHAPQPARQDIAGGGEYSVAGWADISLAPPILFRRDRRSNPDQLPPALDPVLRVSHRLDGARADPATRPQRLPLARRAAG